MLVSIATKAEAQDSARVAASTALLNRGWGMPSQSIGGADDLPAIAIQQLVRKIVDPVQEVKPKVQAEPKPQPARPMVTGETPAHKLTH